MKMNSTPLIIPPAILALAEVMASEKLLLALYASEPKATNTKALKTLSVGLSGLKKIKRRLISKGFLRPMLNGNRVLVDGLAGESPQGHFVTKSEDAEKQHKVAPFRKPRPLRQILAEHLEEYDRIINQPGGCHTATLLFIMERTLGEIKLDVPDGPEKAMAIEEFTTRCDAFYALRYVYKNLPKQQHKDGDRLIANATPEQLAQLRITIDQAKLSGGKPTLLLGLGVSADLRSHESGQVKRLKTINSAGNPNPKKKV